MQIHLEALHKVANRQTNKQRQKHILIGGGSYPQGEFKVFGQGLGTTDWQTYDADQMPSLSPNSAQLEGTPYHSQVTSTSRSMQYCRNAARDIQTV